eukprot:1165795-Amphidinium_carterae.1
MVLAYLQHAVGLGDLSEAQHHILSIPIGDGGFGFCRFSRKRVFHHTGTIFARHVGLQWLTDAKDCLKPSAQPALEEAAAVLGQLVHLVLGTTKARLVLYGASKATTKLPRVYYEGCSADVIARLPNLQPPPHCPDLGAVAHAQRLQHQLSLARLTAPPHVYPVHQYHKMNH